MSVQITIIGLGQIGASIGLALAEHKQVIRRVGLDRRIGVAKTARKQGALDDVKINLSMAVSKADIVLLCLPSDQIYETLEVIAPDLKEDAVVMDTSPVKGAVTDWTKNLLPPGRAYVGLVPIINPAYLHDTMVGLDAARDDLFKDNLMVIAAAPGTPGKAVKLAADLTRLLGATPFFADLAEVDGFMATTHVLPQLVAAALLNATVDHPGWHEARKLAGRAYAEATTPIIYHDDSNALRETVLLNHENVTRVLDGMIASLQNLRQDIAGEDGQALGAYLEQARQGRDRWWDQRLAADWMAEDRGPVPESSGLLRQMFGIRQRPHPGRKDE